MGMAKLLLGTDGAEARWHAWRRAGATYLRWLGLPWRHLLWWGRWHSIKIAHLYASPPDEFECVQTTRLPWLATEGIRWRKTDIRDLWPASLVELFENDEKVRTSQPEAKRTRPAGGDGGTDTERAPAVRTVDETRRERGSRKSRRTVSKGVAGAGGPPEVEPPGARGPWTRCRHGVGLTAKN